MTFPTATPCTRTRTSRLAIMGRALLTAAPFMPCARRRMSRLAIMGRALLTATPFMPCARRRTSLLAIMGLTAIVGIPGSVRTARADAPPGRYTITGGTVTDVKTGLTWQQTLDSNTYNLQQAGAYCSALTLAGGGWRMPSANELQTLVDESRLSPAIDPTAFPDTPADFFWTSSLSRTFPTYGWSITFNQGLTTLSDKSKAEWIRCVR